MTGAWTTVADIRSRVRRRWEDGTFLRAQAAREPFPVVEVPLRGPRVSEIGDDLAAVQAWVAALDAGRRGDSHYTLRRAPVGGRHIGRNELPSHAVITTYSQAWALLGVAGEAERYEEILTVTAEELAVHEWVARQPLRALQVSDAWPTIVAAYRWLDGERGSGRYLREVTAPGVDTKFIERHRALLAQLLDVPGSSPGFLSALGLRAKPETVRLRAHPGHGLLAPFSEAVLRMEELAAVDVAVDTAVIVENEITFLTMPIPAAGVVIWGKGFEVNRSGSLPWLRDTDVYYWGDLDTHGFAILNQLRAWLPQTVSFLMDRKTLLSHRERWVFESSPTAARLDRLSAEERALYVDLVADRLGERIRLEQERIDWTWAKKWIPYC